MPLFANRSTLLSMAKSFVRHMPKPFQLNKSVYLIMAQFTVAQIQMQLNVSISNSLPIIIH